jgi:TetR/AcrR family transcriptional regulator, transcriptional repressor for nem operon
MLQTKGQETHNHILKESRRLFTLQGFQNTSISEIITATGVKKGNLYYHFPSKEELGLAVLIDARDEFFTILENSLTGEQAVERILHSCNSIMVMMQQNNFVGGCLFGNTALEMTDSSSQFGKIIREVFTYWINLIEQELRLAAESEDLKNALSSDTLATAIVAVLEGGIMLSRVYQDKSSMEACISAIQGLITMES